MELIEIWDSLRGLIRDSFTFNQIKELAGASGLPIRRLSHLQQRELPAKGASKSQLLDAIDDLLNDQSEPNRNVEFFIKEIVRRKPQLYEALDEALQRFGWYFENGELLSTDLKVDTGTVDFRREVQNSLSNCFRRYHDGDYSGAVTCICGSVDSVTEEVYTKRNLGNPHDDSYQQRVNKAFSSLEGEFKSEFKDLDSFDDKEVGKIWSNYRKSINQAAYVLGAFRRNISDTHGVNDCPREFVQKALDCGTYILRSFTPYIDEL